VYTFLNKLSSDDERAKMEYSKTWELTCDTGSVHTVSRICSEAKISIRQKGFPIFTSPGKKHNMQKRVTNLDDFEKDVLRRTIFGSYDSGEFLTANKLALELRDKINYRGSVS
jgi:hypothetical protein